MNSICPGVTTTEIVEKLSVDRAKAQGITKEEMMKEMSKDIPLQRANEPEDIAAWPYFWRQMVPETSQGNPST